MMPGDIFLGRNGCASDEMVTEYFLRAGSLYVRSSYDGRVVGPMDWSGELADLERRAAISREMADNCYAQGIGAGDYPDRARACEEVARAILAAFSGDER